MAYFQVTFNDAVNNLERGYIVKAESLKEVNGIMCSYLTNLGDFNVRVVKLFIEVEPKVSCEKYSCGYICRMYASTLDMKDYHSQAELRLFVDASSEDDARIQVLEFIKHDIPIKAPAGISDVEKSIIGFIK
nr:MAG TPA: hypothetical protein [Caudoviricetes sp.]